MAKLKDTDPMPYGKHKGIAMANVPASYLLWLYDNCYNPDIRAYIRDNMDALKQEIKK